MLLWVNYAQASPLGTTYYARTPAQPTQTQLSRSTGTNSKEFQFAHQRRALNDIFNTLNSAGETQAAGQNEHKSEATHTPNANELASQQHPSMTMQAGLFSHIATSASTTTGSAKETTAAHSQAAATTQGKYSVIGTLPPVPTPTRGNTIMTSWTSTPTYAPAPTLASTPSSSKDQAIKQWKIIGVAVIAFSTVAAILLLAVFFDQWWRFVKDVFGRNKQRKLGKGDGELVPDWEKASWEVRFGDDRHRYPSFSSFPSETGMRGRAGGGGNEGGWVRPQASPSPLGQTVEAQREQTQEDTVAQEADILTMDLYHHHTQSQTQQSDSQYDTRQSQLARVYHTPTSPLPSTPAPALTRSRSQRSQRGPDPFDDPPPPRSPGMRSISARSIGGESVYGGIA